MENDAKIKFVQKIVDFVVGNDRDPNSPIAAMWKRNSEFIAKWEETAKEVEAQLYYLDPFYKSVIACILINESPVTESLGVVDEVKEPAKKDIQSKHEEAIKKLTEHQSIANGC